MRAPGLQQAVANQIAHPVGRVPRPGVPQATRRFRRNRPTQGSCPRNPQPGRLREESASESLTAPLFPEMPAQPGLGAIPHFRRAFPACTLGPGRAPRPVLSLNATESMQGHQCPARSLVGIHFRTDPRPPIATVPPHCGPQKSFLHLEIHQRLHRPTGRDCFAGRRQPRQRHWHSCGSGVGNDRGGSLGQKLGRQAVRGAATVRWSLTSPCTFRPMRC